MRERENDLLMHAPVSAMCSLFLLFFFFYYLVLFLILWFSISLLFIFPSLSVLPPSFLATSHPFYTSEFYGISPFGPQGFTNHFLFLVGISPYLPTNLLVSQLLPLLRVFLLQHSPFPNKIPCFVSPPPPYLPNLQWIRTRGPHYTYPYDMHQVAPAMLTSFGLNSIPARHFSKKSLGRNLKIDIFSPHRQTTPSKSPN